MTGLLITCGALLSCRNASRVPQMKLPCKVIGVIAEAVCALLSDGSSDLAVSDIARTMGVMAASHAVRVEGPNGMPDMDVEQWRAEGERLGKDLAEFFLRERRG